MENLQYPGISTVILMGVQIALCGTGLLALMLGLIFKDKFRKDMLAGQGEASFLRVFSVKGAAVLVLSGLFLVGFLYPTYQLDLADKLEKKAKDLKRVQNELDQTNAEWRVTGRLHPDKTLGEKNVWVFSKMGIIAALQADKSRVFTIHLKMEKNGYFPSIRIQPEAEKFGMNLPIDIWKKDKNIKVDYEQKIISFVDPIKLRDIKYDFPNAKPQKPSKSDESISSELEKAKEMSGTWE